MFIFCSLHGDFGIASRSHFAKSMGHSNQFVNFLRFFSFKLPYTCKEKIFSHIIFSIECSFIAEEIVSNDEEYK